MPGLIPLVLQPSSPSSWTSQSPRSPPPRQSNIEALHMAKPKLLRSQAQPAPLIPTLPYTSADWKCAISEIKRLHMTRRYRLCASACSDILDRIKDTAEIEPLYLIYLHFYAATSTELCARPLPASSHYRVTLLQQARSHFDQAAKLIQAAEESVTRKIRSSSASPSWSSSCHSPAGSVSSRSWTVDTRLSSPTNSVGSFEDLSSKSSLSSAGKKRVHKKVSFSLPPEDEVDTLCVTSVVIRPDSPTLGFNLEASEDYFHVGAALQRLPEIPMAKAAPELPLQTVVEESQLNREEEDSQAYHHQIGNHVDFTFLATRSAHRFYEHLADLRAQLASHTASVDAQLDRVPPLSSSLTGTGCRDDAPIPVMPDVLEAAACARSATVRENLCALDRQGRIERLRKSGWQRKRFDARRYEELCEVAMAELS